MLKKKISTVSSIMKPLMKTRAKLKEAKKLRQEQKLRNVEKMVRLDNENTMHSTEIKLADQMIDALDKQLEPVDSHKNQ